MRFYMLLNLTYKRYEFFLGQIFPNNIGPYKVELIKYLTKYNYQLNNTLLILVIP
jgi:hypothetical protein